MTEIDTKTEPSVVAEEIIETAESKADIELLKEMIGAGVMYGHTKTKTNPKFKPYIIANRNNVEIIDLAKTVSAIGLAAEFLKNLVKENKMILLVGTQPSASGAIENLAKKFNLPHVKNRWPGGLITNFKSISGRLEYFKKVQADMALGEFDKHTKKERVVINKNIERMRKLFGGLENLTKLPDALLVVDTAIKGHLTAIKEARQLKIPIVSIIDSDDNPDFADYPIPANDHAKMSVDWVMNCLDKQINI
ncbi:MAG: 30S ribosomal protein S2 [Candidatus Wolfebacteria bacterium GW2011_GWA2_42_10]|uniref:Small ribosomal subunit protein uS2 n=2 Tax=Candidatus Wolfeibacteriota TaxID=1752735 RepID=A0A0G0XKU2_9BACT|nr:MAG: 30S ribosomal protein S2 [Candidatus Wolfebacteria bacterium GW2011_GWB1_41_12]KKS25530.1 MAG: 30S ribosomal protein S2 [Candidatus Wolfebacteria bacterium GW2011_GWA2_42_10]KKT56584.1 MAG: 30S ribosomal protein S2 [Candidatus Wolfebacteria bacterium GW2011_GWA1_44_24]